MLVAIFVIFLLVIMVAPVLFIGAVALWAVHPLLCLGMVCFVLAVIISVLR